MIDRGPRRRLHVPAYRDACYYGRPSRCWLCQFRPTWYLIQRAVGPTAARLGVGLLLVALAVLTLLSVAWLFSGVI